MIDTIGPILFTLFIWWFSTGLILWLDRLPRSTFPYSMAGACVVALAGFVALYTSREKTDVASAYCASWLPASDAARNNSTARLISCGTIWPSR